MFAPLDVIYQLFVGRHPDANCLDHAGEVLSRLQTFAWDRLRERGVTQVYLLGLWDNRGPIVVASEEGVDLSHDTRRTPSVFAITNHTQVNPLLGTNEELARLVDTLSACHLGVIVDFVPNHTGRIHPWVSAHAEYYHHTSEGFLTEFSGDVYKLNYEHPGTVAAMKQVLMTLAGLGVAGVRADMAHLVPLSFWREALTEVKQAFPGFLCIAEAYAPSLFDTKSLDDLVAAGFDLLYHETLYRNFKQCLDAHEPLAYLEAHLTHYLAHTPATRLNYVSNHDDPSPGALETLLALVLLLPSPLLLYNGSMVGMHKRLSHHSLELLPAQFDDFAHATTPLDHYVNLRLKGHVAEKLTLTNRTFELKLRHYPDPIHITL